MAKSRVQSRMRMLVLLLALLGVVAVVVLACGETSTPQGASHPASSSPSPAPTSRAKSAPPTAAATTPPKPKSWVTVQTFSGTQNTKTPTFQLNDGARIVWSAKPTDQYGGAFSITSYLSDGTYGDLIANTTVDKDQSGTYTVHGSNKVYLDISSFSVSYRIQVQEYR